MKARVTLLPGDGIGPEVTAEAEKLIAALAAEHGVALQMDSALIGGFVDVTVTEALPNSLRGRLISI